MALLLVAMSAGIGSVHAGDLPAEDALPGVGRPAAKLSGKSNIVTWSYASSQTGIRPPWFSAVSASAEHSCGLRSNGSVECWGNNGSGGRRRQQVHSVRSPQAQSIRWAAQCVLGQQRVQAGVTASRFIQCGLRRRRAFVRSPQAQRVGSIRVGCAGKRVSGVLGQQRVQAGVTADRFIQCGLRRRGSFLWAAQRLVGAVCWGANDDRQATPPGGSFTSVSTGLSHSCGLRSGLVVCWGSSFFGQASPPAGSFSAVSAGADHSCGVRSDGLVVCWGEDEFGEA